MSYYLIFRYRTYPPAARYEYCIFSYRTYHGGGDYFKTIQPLCRAPLPTRQKSNRRLSIVLLVRYSLPYSLSYYYDSNTRTVYRYCHAAPAVLVLVLGRVLVPVPVPVLAAYTVPQRHMHSDNSPTSTGNGSYAAVRVLRRCRYAPRYEYCIFSYRTHGGGDDSTHSMLRRLDSRIGLDWTGSFARDYTGRCRTVRVQ